MFDLHYNVFMIFLYEVGLLKKYGKGFRVDRSKLEDIMNKVLVPSLFEFSYTKIKGNVMLFIKLGYPDLSSSEIWNEYLQHLRRVHPPRQLT